MATKKEKQLAKKDRSGIYILIFLVILFATSPYLNNNWDKMGGKSFLDLEIKLVKVINDGYLIGDNIAILEKWENPIFELRNPYFARFDNLRITYTLWNFNHTTCYGTPYPLVADELVKKTWFEDTEEFERLTINPHDGIKFEVPLNSYDCEDCNDKYLIEIRVWQDRVIFNRNFLIFSKSITDYPDLSPECPKSTGNATETFYYGNMNVFDADSDRIKIIYKITNSTLQATSQNITNTAPQIVNVSIEP